MNDPIRMMKCYACGRLLYPSIRYTGKPCKCGSLHARYAEPTRLNRAKYIWHEVPGLINKIREFLSSEVGNYGNY